MRVLLLLGLFGCAREREPVVASAPPVSSEPSAPPPAPDLDPGAARPRLSQTITLGQQESYAPALPQVEPPAPPQPGVVVNNQVWVAGGYLGRPYGYTYPRAHSAPSGGWDGPRRTAAPGQTPNVGGNWPTPPSYGPATMK